MGTYTVHVAGESFDNSDGKSRQSIIKGCEAGEAVGLLRDPENKYDENAIIVLSERGQIGHIGRSNAEWMADAIDRDQEISASIERIAGRRNKRGVVLVVKTGADASPEAGGEIIKRAPPLRTASEDQERADVLAKIFYLILTGLFFYFVFR